MKYAITALVYNKRGRLIAIGKNSYVKTHPLQAKAANLAGEGHKIYLHAEIDALTKLKDWRQIGKMVVTRYTHDGKPALAKPCATCMKALAWANVTNVEYTK